MFLELHKQLQSTSRLNSSTDASLVGPTMSGDLTVVSDRSDGDGLDRSLVSSALLAWAMSSVGLHKTEHGIVAKGKSYKV